MSLTELIGTIQSTEVTDQNDKKVFSQIQGETLATSVAEFQTKPQIGQDITGFIYENKAHQFCLTTVLPKVRQDHYAYGTVTSVRRDLGVFVNIGLSDKDIVVSLDDLPEETSVWPAVGDRLMVSLSIDKKGRMWGKLAEEPIFRAIAKRASEKMRNNNVAGTVYRSRHVGSFLMTDDYYLGFVHYSEADVPPRLGEHVSGRVIGLTSEHTLNISLKPRAYEEIGDDAQMILAVLKRNAEHTIDFNDKSDPTAIKDYFGISKSAFKRALGHLLKADLIAEKDGKTYLK